MKIIHIIPNLKKGGAERIVIDIVRGLIRLHGVEVKLILFENKIEYAIEDLSNNIEIVSASVQLSLIRKNVFHTKALQQVFDTFCPDIIHTHLFEAELVSRSCFFPTATWFTHCHDRMQSFDRVSFLQIRSKRQLTNFYEKYFLVNRYLKNGGNNFITISEDIERYFQQVLPSRLKKIHLLYNCIDVSRFQRADRRGDFSLQEPIKLISVGRLDENKNHEFLIDVVQELEFRHIPIFLSIIGDGVKRQKLQQKIDSMNLTTRIKLLGLIENVEDYLAQSTLYVHAAKTEGFGLTLIEAMASGLPVVSLDGGGNRMLINNGENGFLIQEHSVKLMAEKIQTCIVSTENYFKLVANAKMFAEKFDVNEYLQKLIEIYKKSK